MDEFVKQAFDKAKADLEIAKDMAGGVMELFDERFEAVMEGWRRNIGERAANNFCKAIFAFNQEAGLTRLLSCFFAAGWFARNNEQDECADETENDAADRTFNGTTEMLKIYSAAAKTAGAPFGDIAGFVNEDNTRQDTFVKFIQSLVHLGFHIGWRERGKTK